MVGSRGVGGVLSMGECRVRTLARVGAPVVVASFLMASSISRAEVHWTPAHGLAPEGGITGPAAADLDGDLDYDVTAFALTPVRHYWNVGTPQIPAWQLDLTQFPSIPSCGMRRGAFGDLDLDGDLDLVIGSYDGFLRFCWNVGDPQNPEWLPDDSMFEGVFVYSGGTYPSLGDLDADGDLDLTVSEQWGNVRYIENTGTVTEPAWTGQGSIPGIQFAGGSHPCAALGDIDGDGDLDAVGLTVDTPPQCWENVGTPEVSEFIENPSMLIGVDGPAGGGFGLVLLDIDADGSLDLLIAGWDWENLLYLNASYVPVERTSWGAIKALYRGDSVGPRSN